MTDPLKTIPLEGTWTIASSERSYDWIGPDSTIPYLGRVFRAFDQFIPLTRMIRWLRKWYGRNTDSLDGSHTLTILECGGQIEFMGMTFDRKGNAYEANHNIGGTLHQYRLEVQSDMQLEGSFTFEIAEGSHISPEGLTQLKDAGLDPQELLADIHMESDRPFAVTFSGSGEQEKQARKKISECECEAAFGAAVNAAILTALYSLPDWKRPRADRAKIIGKFVPPVVDYVRPLIEGKPMGSAPVGTGGGKMKNAGKTLASVSVHQPGHVTIENKERWNELPPVVQQATAVHETTHQAQLRGRRTEIIGEHTAGEVHEHGDDRSAGQKDVGDVEDELDNSETEAQFAADEVEASSAEYEFLADWMQKNCKSGNFSASNLPGLGRDLYAEAMAAAASRSK